MTEGLHGAARTATSRPTRVGWAALGVAGIMYLAGSNIGSGWVVIIASAMLAGVITDVLAARSAHRGVAAKIVAASAGDSLTAGWVELAASPVSRGRVTLEIPDAGGRAAVPADLAPAGEHRVRLAFAPGRGELRGTHVTVRTTGPLGLGVREESSPHAWPHVTPPAVLPATGRVGRLSAAPTAYERAEPRAPGQDEVVGLRERTSADAAKDVHWRASARHQTLLVRQRGGAAAPRLRIQLEGGRWERDLLDAATIVARSLAESAQRAGLRGQVEADGQTATDQADVRRLLASLPPSAGAAARPLDAPARAVHEGGRPPIVIARDGDGLRIGAAHVASDVEQVRAWLAGTT